MSYIKANTPSLGELGHEKNMPNINCKIDTVTIL